MNIQTLDNAVYPGLPLGFADQVMDLQIKLQQQQSLQLMQILTQMYKIAVDYYIDADIKKAAYFQRKLNSLAVKSISAISTEKTNLVQRKNHLPNTINRQIEKYKLGQKTYVKQLVENNKKQEIKIKKHVEDNLQKQQQKLQGRKMLRRVKSQQRLFNK